MNLVGCQAAGKKLFEDGSQMNLLLLLSQGSLPGGLPGGSAAGRVPVLAVVEDR
jgi:hypothetical protein